MYYDLSRFCSYLQKKRNTIHTHNSSWIILKKLEGESLDISWVVSNLFCLSHLESLFSSHYNKIIETIENSVSLFQNLFFLLCKIIRFRHYFGDAYSFSKGSNMPFVFCYFFLWKDNTNNWLPYNRIHFHFHRKSFSNFDRFVWLFYFI